ncbi:MAG TPA: HAMP domain-containing sensor histidine kinase [Bryobacteraceae bacterium]|nr:HAMP domain-containing sensor histidine kinase [Bryobacteraceae bacterium]
MMRLPLLWRVFLSTSLVTTALFALVGWLAQNHLLSATHAMLGEELQTSFQAYQASWKARADHLASLSRVISGMPDVRSAFGTGDQATIRDTASELWSRVSPGGALFLVTSPDGKVIADLGGTATFPGRIEAVTEVAPRFPAQGAGFSFMAGRLYQIVITPVYVEAGNGPALINVLVAAFAMDAAAVAELKRSSGGSELVIRAGGRTIASTLPLDARAEDWSALSTQLTDVLGRPVGELQFLRPMAAGTQRLQSLGWQIAAIWAAAILIALLLTFTAARRVLHPIRELDHAAREIAGGNYDYRVPIGGNDEMGRLGAAFNAMSASIQQSRAELIRQERINMLGRIAGSVVHDLKNPLAAIYSGAEMLVDSPGLPAAHSQRIATNIYRASRQVLATLDDLTGLVRGTGPREELCRVAEIVEDAWAGIASQPRNIEVRFRLTGDLEAEVSVARTRVERVFTNLFANSVEAMQGNGTIQVAIEQRKDGVMALVVDSGPGIPAEIRGALFQPFATVGKKGGLGLGLALSRQALLDGGGNLTYRPMASGACFEVLLPGNGARRTRAADAQAS